MEFINEEIQTKLGLTPEQIEGIKPLYNDHLSTLQKEWDGKANTNAEGILTGAAVSVEKVTGVKRNDGEKIADYIQRSGGEFLKSKESELTKLKSDYEEKIKGVKGNEALTAAFEEMKAEKEQLLKKYADYDKLAEYASKVDELTSANNELTKRVTFGSIKPNFPDTVNPFEAKARWDEFVSSIEKEWDVKLVEGVPTAVNKENPYKTEKLEDLLKKDENINNLLQGRQQGGTGAQQKDKTKIEGVPFEVPNNLDLKEQTRLIQEQVSKEGYLLGSSEFSARFSELNTLINKQRTASK